MSSNNRCKRRIRTLPAVCAWLVRGKYHRARHDRGDILSCPAEAWREAPKKHRLANPRIRLPRIKSRRPHNFNHKYSPERPPNEQSDSCLGACKRVLNPIRSRPLPSPWMVVMGVQFGIELLLLIDHFGFRVFRFSMCTFRLTCCGSAQDVGFTREPEWVRILS
jgi:hypothetical protein